ncbi:MAG: ribonuclease HII [Bdellovibrionales bacterium]|nr:ribonuclease HII [Bdellovibrionales bacterium]
MKTQKQKNPAPSKIKFAPFAWQNLLPVPIIGVDEVGRGCLAGPVYAAAVIINSHNEHSCYSDSKTLTEKRREVLSKHIQQHHLWSIGFATIEEISRLNILHAALLAMKRAVEGLGVNKGHVIVDGNKKISDLPATFNQTTLIKGDLRATPVAAASIVAKVARDQWMAEQAQEFPVYQFEKHKGYSTALHKELIAEHGPCRLHRPTFRGVKEFLPQSINSSEQGSLF